MKVTLEHQESASIRSTQADQEDGQSAKTTKFQHNTTSEEVTIHGGRKVQQRAIQGGIQGDISGGIQGGIRGGVQGVIQGGVNETTNLPHGFTFDPSEGFKLDDPQHEVGHQSS